MTYTQNNQVEISKKLREINGFVPAGIKIKGWFSFLLEDLIRPYQRCYFGNRISNIIFDQTDPHRRNGRNIPGRSERVGQSINPRYFLSKNRVHTPYISTLATRICDAEKTGRGRSATYAPIERLASIYDLIVIDEVQDLVGWDYSVLEYILSNQDLDLYCVGDYRQTIYQTSHANKNPKTSDQKRQWFIDKGFTCQDLNHSWRCVDEICLFANILHAHQGYPATTSNAPAIPADFEDHIGIFTVSNDNVAAYLEQYNPTILRRNRSTRNDLCGKHYAQNYGKSKGLGFNRVLIIQTENYSNFLQGQISPLREARTEEALNKLYVAITRAKYSVAFFTDEASRINSVTVWTP
ncbi:MAG: 3'-5' exonuclease [Roseibium sp.]